MCDLSSPEYRHCLIMSPSKNLEPDSSYLLATELANDATSAAVVDSVVNLIYDDFPGIEVELQDEPTRLTRSPTNIIDFPRFNLTAEKFSIECRMCATVCSSEADSKLWVRYLGIANNANNQNVYDQTELLKFYQLVERINSSVSEELKKSYVKTLNDIDGDLKFDKSYELSISTVSGDDAIIDEYFDHEFLRHDISDSSRLKLGKNLISDTLRTMNPSLATLPSTTASKSSNVTSQLLGIDVDRFVQGSRETLKSVVALEFSDSVARFFGIGFDPKAGEIPENRSVAHLTSLRLGDRYGLIF